MYRVLVLGASGFIGGHIAKQALESGWQVHGLRRTPGSVGHLHNQQISWIEGNLDDYSSLSSAMAGMAYVFHAAASYPADGDPSKASECTYAGAAQMNNVIRASREAGIKRLIYTSSITTIGVPPPGGERLADERDFYQPGSLPDNGYYEVKSAMENLALEAAGAGDDIVILNPTLVLGPGDTHLSSSEILLMIARGQARAVPAGIANIIDVRDAARAHIDAARVGKAGQRYIVGGENYSIREAVSLIAEIAAVKPPAFIIPNKLIDLYLWAADRLPLIPFPPYHLRAYRHWQGYNVAKARTALSLQTRMLEETARDSLKWFADQGVL